jgi:hypothetical protein
MLLHKSSLSSSDKLSGKHYIQKYVEYSIVFIVGIATRYEVDGSELEAGGGKSVSLLHTGPDRSWGPSILLYSE